MAELFDSVFIDNNADKTLFLLHGTGGSKNDFLFLDDLLSQTYNLVGLQGNIVEDGLARFFMRYPDGTFHQHNIDEETRKLSAFLSAWCAEHRCSPERCVFLGYSNGANMILATLFSFPTQLQNLLLLHARLPFVPEPQLQLPTHRIFFTTGDDDPFVNTKQQEELESTLRTLSPSVVHKHYTHGHQIGGEEMRDVKQYLESLF